MDKVRDKDPSCSEFILRGSGYGRPQVREHPRRTRCPRSAFSVFGLRTWSFPLLSFLLLLCTSASVLAQPRPYIGYAYPAGGQQGTSVQIRLGGQGLDGLNVVRISGPGVTARLVEYLRPLNNQEIQLLNEQVRTLKQSGKTNSAATPTMMSDTSEMMSANADQNLPASAAKLDCKDLIDRIEKRTREFVQTPASPAIASLALIELTIAPDADPGEREIRLVTLRGVSNPLPVYVGQAPEISRPPMQTSVKQVLGKESQALRKRPPREVLDQITPPCILNGQIASGEVNRYRFHARKGEHLVIETLARQLVPFIADAVPGWFQPVLTLYDASGKEVAYDDDYRFNPDPTILFEVPADGEYVLEIRDSIYRGREDFVYRTTIGENPFISSIFPLGGKAGTRTSPKLNGWNLKGAELRPVAQDAAPGTRLLAARKKDLVSNYVPFAVDALDEALEHEPNNTPQQAQKVFLPLIVNGRIDPPDDWDVFQFIGKSNETVVAEVQARRLDSPLDSVLKLTDAEGNMVAFNDDHEDLAAGINTHHADSYLLARLPADGTYYVHIGDTARQGGDEFGYRLRLSAPRPDFDLRVVPSSLSLRSKSSGTLTVYARRKDGFSGPIKVELLGPPPGFSASPLTLSSTQVVARLNIKTTLATTGEPVTLSVVGSARSEDQEIRKEAVAAEDRMQAFLWRHLVPARDLEALVFDPSYQVPPKRIAPALPPVVVATNGPVIAKAEPMTNAISGTNAVVSGANSSPAKPKFSKQQVAARLRQLKALYEEGMLTDDFYLQKVSECETVQ
jgi:hypothetical protein